MEDINQLTFGMDVPGKNPNQRKFLKDQLCFFKPGDGHLLKSRHVIFT